MRSLTLYLMLLVSSISSAQIKPSAIDPDLVDVEMVKVMYQIAPKDLKTRTYQQGVPSEFNIKLCSHCQIKPYSLIKDAELLLNEQPLALEDLTITLIKKKFDVIQLGIDRSNKTVTYLYLGGISESSAEELAQEQSDES